MSETKNVDVMSIILQGLKGMETLMFYKKWRRREMRMEHS
jgi:hypothetical protein